MKILEEIKEKIADFTKENLHVLDCYPSTMDINTPKALMQLSVKVALDGLYWTIGEKRPEFKCDDFTKENQ